MNMFDKLLFLHCLTLLKELIMWIIYALLAALFFGTRGVMYQWTSQKNLDRNLMLFGVFFVCNCLFVFVLKVCWVFVCIVRRLFLFVDCSLLIDQLLIGWICDYSSVFFCGCCTADRTKHAPNLHLSFLSKPSKL